MALSSYKFQICWEVTRSTMITPIVRTARHESLQTQDELLQTIFVYASAAD